MKVKVLFYLFAILLAVHFSPLCTAQGTQNAHPHHSHSPYSSSNDPQLALPPDQAQYCATPPNSGTGYEQFQTYDAYPEPASRGYLCIQVPGTGTFVIDYIIAEADYDSAPAASPEWYLYMNLAGNETMSGFAAQRVGSSNANPHYLLSQPVKFAVSGGSRITLIMHNYFISANSSIVETPGTASLTILGHWE